MKKISPTISFLLGMVTLFVLGVGYMVARRGMPFYGREVARITSPDGLVDAVIMRVNLGSLTSDEDYLFLVEKGGKIKSAAEPANMQTSEGDTPKVFWLAPHFLSVDPGNAHVESFNNLWYSYALNSSGYFVELDYEQSSTRHYLEFNGRLHGLPYAPPSESRGQHGQGEQSNNASTH